MAKPASEIFRAYVTDGIPSTGPHPPSKTDVREWAVDKDLVVANLQAGQASLDSSVVRKTGANTLEGNYTVTGAIAVTTAPTNPNHVARKADVDVVAGGYKFAATAAEAATTTALPTSTYNNGAGTITGNSNGALSAQDGVTLTVNQRLVVKDQADPVQNGLYALTTVGSGGAPFVLTRATDADSAAELARLGVYVKNGSANAGARFVINLLEADINIGTTEIVWSEFGGNDGLAPIDSPTFTGTPAAPTPADGDDSTSIATTAFVRNPDNIRLNSLQHTPDPFPGIGPKPVQFYTAAGRSVDSWLTFARSSAARYTDGTGRIVSADSGAARFNVDPDTFLLAGLKSEGAGTNSAQKSEELEDSYWTKTNLTIDDDAAVAPDGQTTADRATVDASAGQHHVRRDFTTTANAPYTYSVYIKPNGAYTKFQLQVADVGSTHLARVTFDTVSGLFSAVTLAGTATAGLPQKEYIRETGYWRISLTVADINATTLRTWLNALDDTDGLSFTGDGTSTFDWWGCQFEPGRSMSSYIPTTTEAVERAQDLITFAPDFLNPVAGVILWRGRLRPNGATQYIWTMDDNTAQNFMMLRHVADGRFSVLSEVGDVGQPQTTAAVGIVDERDVSVAFAYGPTGSRIAVTGQSIVASAAVPVPSGYTHGRLGHHRVPTTDPSYCDHYQFAFIPGLVSDEELNSLVGNVTEEPTEEFPPVKPFVHLITHGQSLARGSQSIPPLSETQVYNALTFTGGVRAWNADVETSKALIEEVFNTTEGETPCTQSARTFSELLAQNAGKTTSDVLLFASTPGRLGLPLASFLSGSVSQRFNIQAQKALALAQAAGRDYAASVVYWLPGAADVTDGTPFETYKEQLKALRSLMETTINGLTGRNDPLYMVMHQTLHDVTDNDEIALAEIAAAREDRRIIVMGPNNQFPVAADNRHFTNEGSRLAGAYYGKAAAAIYGEQRRPSVIEPIAATAVGTALTIRFAADYDLVLDDGTYTFPTTDEGFRVVDDTGDLTLSSIDVVNNSAGRFVTMTLNRTLDANPRVRYSLDYTGTGLDMFDAASGNLRDSDPTQVRISDSPSLINLPNLCPAFELDVQVIV